MTQSDCCEADFVRSKEINHHISAVTSSEIEVAADLSSSKAAAVFQLSSADSHSHHHLVKCPTSTNVAAKRL